MDKLTEDMATELDTTKRQAEINEASKLVQADFAYIPLHQQTIVWAARDNIDVSQPPDNTIPMRWVKVK